MRVLAMYFAAVAVLVSFNSSMVTAQVRVSPEEMEERIIYQVPPTYPREARVARIQGRVEIDVVVDEEGQVADLQVIVGHPLLAEAATEAVSQWLFDPYTVAGQPVEVATMVNVTFELND